MKNWRDNWKNGNILAIYKCEVGYKTKLVPIGTVLSRIHECCVDIL